MDIERDFSIVFTLIDRSVFYPGVWLADGFQVKVSFDLSIRMARRIGSFVVRALVSIRFNGINSTVNYAPLSSLWLARWP